ncbi:TPA: methyltransferase domain-containing protein [Clostridium botulinum]|uniref:methyltransferase domain-containing protein n=2 Tax=Clostridium botulinum TaxID=1491 RepID=UPI00090B8457|nr:methyltransferase domain-containing protein [Clostridium botulinum]APC81202.1 mycolic acid cyclopropane synthetase family protein [Clostridium botulinum]UUN83204.1 methyltransferase domain-containing protein [Clostridium botulinum]
MDNSYIKLNEIKSKIKNLIDINQLDYANKLIDDYIEKIPNDIEIYSMKAITLIIEGKLEEAESILKAGLELDYNNFDLNYNLAYVYEQDGYISKASACYNTAKDNCKDNNLRDQIENILNKYHIKEPAKKIIFFVKQGMDSFIDDIIEGLSQDYITIKSIVTDFKQIDKGMKWADICWFEWCDELIIYGSKLELAKEKTIICRLHSYEAFEEYPSKVNWDIIDKIIFISENIKNLVVENFQLDNKKIATIPNGIDINKYNFKERKEGFNIAYVGYINYKKGPMLLLQTFKAICDKNPKYKLFIAGKFQDSRDVLYFKQMIKEFGIEKNVFFEGWKDDLDTWLENKNYIICTSVLESQNISVMQAMSKGIKPIIHNFVGARSIYDDKYIWNSIDESIKILSSNKYNSKEYRNFIESNYSLDKQIKKVKETIENTIKNAKNKIEFNYADYWNNRLSNKFDIEGVGYIGLGKTYNKYLYKNRIYILDNIIKSLFNKINKIKVLELGPGVGVFTDYYRKQEVEDYTAIDISEKSVKELSRSYEDYKFINGDISDNKYYNNKYDLIFAADVLLHITNEDNYKSTIRNIATSLNDDGVCILLDPISVINTKSSSEHVVIRDKNYVNKILNENGLEMLQIIPVSFFMNYPLDKKLLFNKEDLVLHLFNLISCVFSQEKLTEEHKNLLAQYILNNDRRLLMEKNFGLSEKLMVIKKKKDKNNFSKIDIAELWNDEQLRKEEKNLLKMLSEKNITNKDYFSIMDRLIKDLHQDDLNLEYIKNIFNNMIPYKEDDYDKYDFHTAQIIFGKREKINDNFEIIEFCIKNNDNKILLISNIWYDMKNKRSIFSNEIFKSYNFQYINRFIEEIVKYNLQYNNNIAGFIFDRNIKKDIEDNYIAYIWERGIPCSQFMPVWGYLTICERYKFAASFIKSDYKVLEAPCGFGYGAAYFSKLCSKVEALDLAKDNIDFAKNAYKFNNVNWVNSDVTKLPYKDSEFNVYVSYEVFEHLPLELNEKYLEEAKRVIKDNGKFIISTPNRETRKNINNPFHIKEYNFQEFSNILEKYFGKVSYYSVVDFKVQKGMNKSAFDIIAICEK